MFFEADLRELEREEAAEMLRLHKSSRWAAHILSPTRLARKYPYVCSGAALLAGMWLAPGPHRDSDSRRKQTGGHLTKLLTPLLRTLIPGGKDAQQEEKEKPAHEADGKAAEAVPLNQKLTILADNLNQALQMATLVGGVVLEKLGKPAAGGEALFCVENVASIPGYAVQSPAWELTQQPAI